MPNKDEKTNTEDDNNSHNLKNIIADYLKSQGKDEDKPTKLNTKDQKKTTSMRVSGLRKLGDTKSYLKNSIRRRGTRNA